MIMNYIRRFSVAVLTFMLIPVLVASPLSALSPAQKQIMDAGAEFINIEIYKTCTAGGTPNLTGDENVEKVFNYFISPPRSLPPHQAAAIIGNMTVESGVQPQRLQGTASGVITPAETFSGGSGWGIVQWTPGSKMIDTFQPKSMANDLALQLEFLWTQLQGEGPLPEGLAGEELRGAPNLEEAVLAFQGNRSGAPSPMGIRYFGFERPRDQTGSVAERTQFARDVINRFGSGSPTTPTSATGAAECGGSGALPPGECPTGPVPESETVMAAGFRVHPCIAAEVERIVPLAAAQGMTLDGYGWVSKEGQEAKRRNNGCAGREYDASCIGSPRTAIPGKSRHERGTAIDFTCNGRLIPSRSNECFVFLGDTTSLINFDEEPWHWSNDGG